MKHLFCPLKPKDELRGPVLALAAHPDDEVIGAGGLLAFHGARGDRVTVVHMSDGAVGDPGSQQGDIRAVRRSEGEEALRRLSITDLRRWDVPDGQLPEHMDRIEARLRELLAEVRPATLYSFFFNEAHRDHRAVGAVLVRCADALPPDCRCLLFGVNQVVPGGTLFDTTDTFARKRHAVQAYQSQLAYIDLVDLGEHRDRAATVNVDLPAMRYGELYADLRPDQLRPAWQLCDSLYRLLVQDEG
jgi:LmbE family N-acetylglucosaminyl deacetylase